MLSTNRATVAAATAAGLAREFSGRVQKLDKN
jgi:hypothetical protein